MDILQQDDLKQLIETSGDHCVSFYMPTHRTGREQQQDPIRLKNLITEAQEKLIEYGVRRPDAQELLQSADDLLEDDQFWQHQSDGLAVFLSKEITKIYRLPAKFDELFVVSKTFHVKPLLPLVQENGQFYILAVSLDKIRLFLCTQYVVTEKDLPDVPTSMQEALYMDHPEKHLGYHTGTKNPITSGNRPAVFHGQQSQAEDEDKNILRYFQIVDKGLSALLGDTSIPLVLAGVDYLLPIYHKANSYAGLIKDGLEGNPDELSGKELHQRVWKIVEPIFDEDRLKAIKQFEELHGSQSELAADDLETVVKAAKYGQIETLFVSLNVQHWGRFDQENNRVKLNGKPNLKNEDLLNFAAAQTILNAGKVHALQPDNMPGDTDLAAILRFPIAES